MYIGRPIAGDLGFSLNPFHYVKKAAVAAGHGVEHGAVAVGHGVSKGVHAVGHGVAVGGKFVAHHAVDVAKLSVLPVVEMNKYILQPILHVALTPVRHKVDTLKSRRARKIAWDKRRSTTPTPQENNEARSWTKSYLKKEVPPFGLMLSLLAGASPGPYTGPGAMFGALGDPTTATIIASVPTLLAIINKILTRSNKNGEAPADPTKGGAPGGAPPGPPGPPPGPDAGAPGANAAAPGGADAGADDGSGGGGGGGGGGGAKLLGMPKKYVIIGGAVFGGVILLSRLTSKKKGS